ncbi:hypothetical protein KAR91_42285 [Candidatus Pacearchaeota archaeon]|nr:hypothetical protein [Candidatus Pacearchaeota archaeon]
MSYEIIKNPEESRIYKEEKQVIVDAYAPNIHPCKKCGHPVVEGYACTTCYDTNPSVEALE